MQVLQDIISMARNLRAEKKVSPKQPLTGTLYTQSVQCRHHRRPGIWTASRDLRISRWNSITATRPRIHPRSARLRNSIWSLTFQKLKIDLGRLEKEKDQLEKVIDSSERQLSDDTFLARAPQKVVDGIRLKLEGYKTQLDKVQKAIGS